MASGEQQHQEALVAGESPDRSERERSSGETTEGGGVVARPEETAENERLSGAGANVPAPASPAGDETEGDRDDTGKSDGADGAEDTHAESGDAEDGGEGGEGGRDERDTRLKSAVAAWVAGEEPPEGAEDPGSPGDATEGGTDGSGSAESGAGKAGTGQDDESAAASDLPVRPKQSKPAKQSKKAKQPEEAEGKPADRAPEGDAPTAMFGILRPGGDAPAEDGDEAAAERAERLTSAFFGSAKDGKKGGEKGAEDGAGAEGDAEGSAGTDASAKPVDQPTATFRTKGPKTAAEPEDHGGSGASKASGKTSGTDGATGTGRTRGSGENGETEKDGAAAGTATGRPAVDQPTAVFRAPDVPKSARKSAPKDGQKDRRQGGDSPGTGEKPASSGPSATPASSGSSGSSGGKASAAAAAAAGAAAAKSEAAKSAQENGKAAGTSGSPEAKAKAEAAPRADPRKRGEGESEAERTSQFVPLKSADEPRTPAKALPPKAPAAPPAPPKPPSGPLPPVDAGAASQAGQAGPAPSGVGEQAGPEMPRQQPVPDPPPLDLLAQLTNTPPPAETALRTLTRRVKIWTPLVLLVLVVLVVVQAVRPLPGPELTMTASGSYAFKGAEPSVPWPSEGQAVLEVDGLGSLGSYGKQKPVPIASVAKVMTAYVILRDHPVKKGSKGAQIPVDQKAEDEAGLSAQNESTVEVKAGEKITQREALDAIMIASANNVARLLARWDAGSEKAFVKKMNDAAKDLGMTNSKYTDPSGLKAETVSTAADQVKLGKKVMEQPLFREVVRQPQYKDGQGKTQPNWNKLVPVDGVVGIKTGTTTKAGGNLLFAAEKEIGGTKQLIVGAVLGQYKPSILDTVLAESKKLIDTAQASMKTRQVVRKGDVVGYVDDRLGGKTPVVATKDVTAVGWAGLKVKLGLDEGGSIPHEAKPGTKVGSLTVGDGPGQVKVPVALQDSMKEPGFGSRLTRVG